MADAPQETRQAKQVLGHVKGDTAAWAVYGASGIMFDFFGRDMLCVEAV